MDISFCAPADIRTLARSVGARESDVASGLGSTATTPLIQGLLANGHSVTLYTLSRDLNDGVQYNWRNLRVIAGPYRARHLARDYFCHEIHWLQRAIERDAPGFIHAHWTYEFALAPLRLGIPTMVTIHDLPWKVLSYFRDMYRSVRLAMAYEVAVRGRMFTAVSQEAATHFRRYFKPGCEIAVINNGLKDESFTDRPEAVENTGNLVFGTILQGWSERKNPKSVLRAFAQVLDTLPRAELHMYGADYEVGGVAHEWAKKNGLDTRVTFVGVLENSKLLSDVAKDVDVVVHPSLDEAFSVTILEAMALKKPIVAGALTSGMQELLDAGRCGMLVDVQNVQALAEAMLVLGRSDRLRTDLGERARLRAWTHYRMTSVVEQYERLYRRAQSKQGGESCLYC